MSLVEIGPRFVLTPIRIFEGAFGGATVFANPGTRHGAHNVFLVILRASRFKKNLYLLLLSGLQGE